MIDDCGCGDSYLSEELRDIQPWQLHQGFIEDNWSGALSLQLLAILQQYTSLKHHKWKRTLRTSSGKLAHWSFSFDHEITYVDLTEQVCETCETRLMFNSSQVLLRGSGWIELPTMLIKTDDLQRMAFAIGFWLQYRSCVLRGRDFHMQPIIEDYFRLSGMDVNCECEFLEWLKTFCYVTMSIDPDILKPPYRHVMYGKAIF